MILALETATSFGSVALLDAARLLGSRELSSEQAHAGGLLGAVDDLLGEAGSGLGSVGLIALSIGPGSFTGLRVGLATALGLCFETPRRIVPVPTLAALAFQAEGTHIVPLLDARKGQVYTGLYSAQGVALQEDRVCAPRPWFESLRERGPLTLLGPGAGVYRELAEEILGEGARIVPEPQGRPSARRVGLLGRELADRGGALEPDRVELRYLRRAQAEAVRRAGQLPVQRII